MKPSSQLGYLKVLLQQFDGPLQGIAHDNVTGHVLHAMRGVLARLVAGADLAEQRRTELQASCRQWCRELAPLFAAGSDGAGLVTELAALAESEAGDATERIASTLVALLAQLQQRPDVAAQGIATAIVSDDAHYWQKLETQHQSLSGGPLATATTADPALTNAQQQTLLRLMREQCGESTDVRIARVEAVPGGFSKKTILVDLANNRVLPTQLVVRHNIPGSPWASNEVSDEYPLLKVLHECGVKVPQPWLVDTGEVVGTSLMVVSRVPGRVIADLHHFRPDFVADASQRRRIAISMAQAMAAMHGVPLDRLPAKVPGRDTTPVEAVRTQLDGFRRACEGGGVASVVVNAAFRWLYDHIDYAGAELALTHADLRFHNVMVDGDEVSAILDWETAAARHPGFDIGYVYEQVRQLIDWQDFLAAYRDAGGKLPSAETLAFYALRAELYPATTLIQLEQGVAAGAIPSAELAYVGIQLREHAMYLMAERLQAIMAGKAL